MNKISTEFTIPSLAAASTEEKTNLHRLTAREQRWYSGNRTYANIEDINLAVEADELEHVKQDSNITLVGKMRNPDLFEAFPPFLSPHAHRVLRYMGSLWRAEINNEGIIEPTLRLSVTSLTRTEQRQAKLIADPSKLASTDSTHTKGFAFDIDASGYYELDECDKLRPIIHPGRDPKMIEKHAAALRNISGQENSYKVEKSQYEYNPKITAALITVADNLHSIGVINRIVEYGDTNTFNRCLHIAPHPTNFPELT